MQIGRDSRLSGPLLLASMVAGLASQGVSVAQFGMATTPAMFMSCIIPGLTLRIYLFMSQNSCVYADLLSQCVHAAKARTTDQVPDLQCNRLVTPAAMYKLSARLHL